MRIFAYLIALLVVFVNFTHSQFSDSKSTDLDFIDPETLLIGIAEKKLVLRKSPKRLSKKNRITQKSSKRWCRSRMYRRIYT